VTEGNKRCPAYPVEAPQLSSERGLQARGGPEHYSLNREEQYGGDVWIEDRMRPLFEGETTSEDIDGATFVVELPRSRHSA
jgi:hypothetical protein